MKKKLFFKFFVFAVIAAFVTVTSCKDYDDDISRLDSETTAIKTDYAAKIDALKTELNSAIDAKVKTVSDELAALKAKLEVLEESAATQEDIDAAKAEILGKVVALETFNIFKTDVESQLDDIKSDLANAATKAELAAVETSLTTELGTLKNIVDDMGLSITALEESYADLSSKLDANVEDLVAQIAALKSELDPRITTIETLLEIGEDGASGKLNQIADDIASNLEKINANSTAIITLRSDLEEKLEEQLLKINENADDIQALSDSLNAKYDRLVAADDELQRQITENYNELDDKIEVNADEILVLKGRLDAVEDDIDNITETIIPQLEDRLGQKILDAYKSLDHRVYSLTFIPDYTSPDGTPQIVVRGLSEWEFKNPAEEGIFPQYDGDWDENWTVKEEGTTYKGVTTLKYRVSPSNVTLDDFEVTELLHQTSLVRAASKSASISFTGKPSLENGILSVPVIVEASTYNFEDFGHDTNSPNLKSATRAAGEWTNISVALQVKNTQVDDEEDRFVISSEYVKANFDLGDGLIMLKGEEEEDDEQLPVGVDYSEISVTGYPADIKLWNGDTQSGNTPNVLDHTINLNDYVYGVFDLYPTWELVKMTDYGFNDHSFKFKLVTLDNEGVDQSNKYVTLNGETGVIGVKPATGNLVNAAAVGRTPVVEVTAVVDGKVVAAGYIKILITNNAPAVYELTKEAEEPVVLNCDTEGGRIWFTNTDMDEIFNLTGLGKDAFFNEYENTGYTIAIDWDNSIVPDGAEDLYNNSPIYSPAFQFGFDVNDDTQSGVDNNYIYAGISNKAPVGDYTMVTIIRSNGYRPDIHLTWKFTVELPEGIGLTANTNILAGDPEKIIINPSIYGQQGVKTSTVYEALLNNAFVHNNDNFDFGLTQDDYSCDSFIQPYFIFTQAPEGFTISSDGTQILKDNDVAAQIETAIATEGGTKFYLRLNDQTDDNDQVGNYEPYDAAIDLLVALADGGKDVMVQPKATVNGQPLNTIDLYDPFVVKFIYQPLKQFRLNLEPANATIYDQGTNGKNKLAVIIDGKKVVEDFNGTSITFGSAATTADKNLIKHYEIALADENYDGTELIPAIDFGALSDNSKLKVNGVVGAMPTGMFLKVKTDESDPAGNGENFKSLIIEWTNSDTGALQNDLVIEVPISLEHKWGTLNGSFTVTVKPGNGLNP